MTTVVLVLFGFDVYCVCYSEDLSKRDYDVFKPLLDCLELSESIFYETFNRIREEALNFNGDIRDLVKNLIQKGSLSRIK